MAGALGVALEKDGHYLLGEGQRAPAAQEIGRSVRVMNMAAVVAGGALIGLSVAAGLTKARRRR